MRVDGLQFTRFLCVFVTNEGGEDRGWSCLTWSLTFCVNGECHAAKLLKMTKWKVCESAVYVLSKALSCCGISYVAAEDMGRNCPFPKKVLGLQVAIYFWELFPSFSLYHVDLSSRA